MVGLSRNLLRLSAGCRRWVLVAALSAILIPRFEVAALGQPAGVTPKCRLSGNRCQTGEPVTIQQVAHFEPGVAVVSIRHEVWRVGLYQRGSKEFVLIDDLPHARVSKLRSAFPGLAESLTSPGGIPLRDAGDGLLAKSFAFSATEPGVFMIQPRWTIKTRGEVELIRRSANPVLLFVRPSQRYREDAEEVEIQAALEGHFAKLKSEGQRSFVTIPAD
jgi:hypothetical protein